MQEERRLFYVGMTRARDRLVLTSAADYGGGRPRKASRFVVEALDLPSPRAVPRRTSALEGLARHRPPPPAEPGEGPGPGSGTLHLSFRQLDDYETCPLKYRYVHRLRVPLLAHHRVVYGSAVHQAVQAYFRARLAGSAFSEEDLVRAFRAAWVSEGFLSREHEEERLRAGEEALRRFARADLADPLEPTGVEEEFAFSLGATVVHGRYDLVVERGGAVSIVDFKTGAVAGAEAAARRAQDSLQLDVYALGWRQTRGRLPDRVELRFLESGLAGGRRPTPERAEATMSLIRDVAERVRRGEFSARPSPQACGPCAFRDICPHTARASAAS
jgi:DNA helicase-2/ATP-dependent DNA helicase PcrA